MGRLCEVTCEACGHCVTRFGEGVGQAATIFCPYCQSIQTSEGKNNCDRCGGHVTRADGLINDPTRLRELACTKCGQKRLKLDFVGSYYVDSDLEKFTSGQKTTQNKEGWMGDPGFRTPWNQT